MDDSVELIVSHPPWGHFQRQQWAYDVTSWVLTKHRYLVNTTGYDHSGGEAPHTHLGLHVVEQGQGLLHSSKIWANPSQTTTKSNFEVFYFE